MTGIRRVLGAATALWMGTAPAATAGELCDLLARSDMVTDAVLIERVMGTAIDNGNLFQNVSVERQKACLANFSTMIAMKVERVCAVTGNDEEAGRTAAREYRNFCKMQFDFGNF